MMYATASSINSRKKRRTRLINSRRRRTRLLTEVAMRKMKLQPEKLEKMEQISDQLNADDVNFFTNIFEQIDNDEIGIILRSELHEGLSLLGISTTEKELDEYLLIADADGSKAICLDEWIVLCGLLVKPKHGKNELLSAFQSLFPGEEDVTVVQFRSKMQRILEQAYYHLPECSHHEVSTFVDDILSALDPNDTEIINIDESIELLCSPYNKV